MRNEGIIHYALFWNASNGFYNEHILEIMVFKAFLSIDVFWISYIKWCRFYNNNLLIWLILALRDMVRFVSIKAYALTRKCCGHGTKNYKIWEKFTSGLCLVAQLRQKFINMAILFQLLTEMTSLSISLTSVLQHFIIVNKFIISFLFSKLTFCWF